MSENGNNSRLQEAMALLIQNQTALGHHLTALSQQQTAFLARMAETDVRMAELAARTDVRMVEIAARTDARVAELNKENAERFARMEERFGRVEERLLDVERVLKGLPEAVGAKFGFQPSPKAGG